MILFLFLVMLLPRLTSLRRYRDIPIVSRTYLTASFLTTAACALDLVSPFSLYYNFGLIFYKVSHLLLFFVSVTSTPPLPELSRLLRSSQTLRGKFLLCHAVLLVVEGSTYVVLRCSV